MAKNVQSHFADAGAGACHPKAALPGARNLIVPAAAGTGGGAALLALYFGLLTTLSGRDFAREQFADFWPFIVALAAGFGIQVGLFVHLRRAIRASSTVVAVTGTTSGLAMASCCTHYLANFLPILGTTGLVSLVGAYQVGIFWFGLAANLAGIAYMVRQVARFARGG